MSVIVNANTTALQSIIGGKSATVNGGVLGVIDIAQDLTITSGVVNQTGAIGRNLDVSGDGELNAIGTDVTGTVTLHAGATGTVIIQDALAVAPVTVAGGVLNLSVAANGINFVAGATADTGVFISADGNAGAVDNIGANNSLALVNIGNGQVVFDGATNKADRVALTSEGSTLTLNNANAVLTGAVDNTTTEDRKGGIILVGQNTQITGNIGATNSLALIEVEGQAASLGGAVINAASIHLVTNAATLSLTNAATTVTGEIDFTSFTGTVNVVNGVTIDGNISNKDVDNNNGTINFLGGGTVTGVVARNLIGDDSSSINTINIKGAVGTIVRLEQAVGVENLVFANGAGAGTLQIATFLFADNIDFGATGGTLEFDGAATGANLRGVIANGANATLNVNIAKLTTFNPSIGTIQTINIKAGQKVLTIDAGAGDVTLLAAVGQAINFADANSALAFSNESNIGKAAPGTVKLAADLLSSGANQNRLEFFGGNAATEVLNVTNNGGAVINVGNGANTFSKLSVTGFVAATGLNLVGVPELNVLADANFIDNNNTAANIATVNIGGADATLGIDEPGAATYTIDANGGNLNVPGGNIKFLHEDAELVLQNSSAANDRTITLAADISPNNNGEGIVTLNSVTAGKKLTIAGNKTLGGGGHTLNAIRFQGAGDFDTTGTTFNTTDIELDTAGAIKLGATPVNVTLLSDTVQLTQTGNIGGFLDFNENNGTVTLDDTVNIAGNVQNTDGNNNGTLIASGASNIGGSVNGIAMLKVGAGNVAIANGGDVKIGEIQGTGTNTLTLPANFKLTGGINKTGGQALKLNFGDGSSVSDVVGTAANPVGSITTAGAVSFASSVNATGTATFGGNTSFADTFTNTGPVVLANGSTYNFAKDVTATSLKADGATMNFGNSLAFNSDVTGSGTTITLGANQVTYTGQGSFTDTLTLNTILDGATNTGGNILIKSGSTLDLSKVSNLALVITATNLDINNIDEDAEYTVIFAETEGGLKPAPVGNVNATINGEQNRFFKLTFDASSLTLLAENIAEEVIEEDFAPGGPLANIPNAPAIKKSLELMAAAPSGSDARLAFNNWTNLTPIQEADAVAHLIQDVVKPSDTIAAISNQVIASNISSSLINLNARMDELQPVAVAAGDEDRDAKFGAWISPFVGNAEQKKKGNISGYKSDTTGGTIGFDGLVCDDLALGAAYTRADTDIKLKNNKTGDKNKVQSNIYSLYGLYNLPYENFFVEGIASYSDNKIRSKSRRVISTGVATTAYQTANGKYKSESYTGQLMAGYTYVLPENINLTPLAGLRYSTTKDKGYKETGTTHQNLIVKGKNYNSFDGLLGAKLSSNINVGEVVLTPELYAMVDYAFKNKVPAIDARLQGMTAPFPTNSFKQNKTSFDVGVGVTAKHKMMEYGINYDTNIGSKYFAQQGSVKVRVNF